ncbi:Uncharacterised protein [Chryseobacterium gleum]|uniref:Lipoprotein n=2 Tax=Chryseobacterium gleum TaxID=250 RepID=A0A448B897_CHRGE|nr:hypothetical protein [Chryseobacterium gleum]EFK36761.1 hypothetical protein HMPREF0204_11318 [Chryseobacterium gleum ATCC 35910]QQY32017.1 hypothetical protein I6I60_24840 [Chryseobacterium gleum]VEE10762.1 Uncharacterised protein [Chryseobacterium gleum]
MGKDTWHYTSYALIAIIFTLAACKSRNYNYIIYYNKINEADSILRFQKDTMAAVKQYKKIFRQYAPKNQERINEYENYIRLSHQHHKNFGGKKSLYKLIPLVAHNWKYKKQDSSFIQLYQKYGIGRQEIEFKVEEWKRGLNQKLVDSFTVAFKRDQDSRIDSNYADINKNDKKNAELLRWMFENYGFPSLQKIGLSNGDFFMPSGPILLHMADYEEYYPYLKIKLLEYVKSGECPPRDYAAMVDRNNLHHKVPYTYGVYQGYENIKDSATVNRNRKSIGLPSLKHAQLITKDFFKKIKKKN